MNTQRQPSNSWYLRKLAKVIWTRPSARYLAYIRSPAWQKRRRQHLAIYPYCQVDGWRPAIQVHHWTYIRLGHELPDDLCSICLDCHHKIHCMTIPDAANDNQLELPLDETG